jgi:hypothetical protein
MMNKRESGRSFCLVNKLTEKKKEKKRVKQKSTALRYQSQWYVATPTISCQSVLLRSLGI